MLRRACALAIAYCLASDAWGSDSGWTRFRGPNGTGISHADKVPFVWTDADYNWKLKLPGIGHSSPVVWGQNIFLMSADPETGTRYLLCVSTDGKVMWQRAFLSSTHHLHVQNSFASSTPAVDAEHVYVAWATPSEYTLVALSHTGREVWRIGLGPYVSEHGFGSSPVVYDDKVVITNDQDGESFVIAVSASTGKTLWKTPHRVMPRQNASYASPCIYRNAKGKDELIVNCWANGITSLDPNSGKTNWEAPVFDRRPVGSPLVAAGMIFGNCGDGGGNNSVVALKPDEQGGQPKVAYRLDKSISPYVPTLIARDNLLFLWGDRGIVSCLEAVSGKVHWKQRVGGNYSASPILINDRLYGVSADGDVVVLAASDQFEVLARNSLGEASRSTPAVANGVLYLRTESQLFSLGGAKR